MLNARAGSVTRHRVAGVIDLKKGKNGKKTLIISALLIVALLLASAAGCSPSTGQQNVSAAETGGEAAVLDQAAGSDQPEEGGTGVILNQASGDSTEAAAEQTAKSSTKAAAEQEQAAGSSTKAAAEQEQAAGSSTKSAAEQEQASESSTGAAVQQAFVGSTEAAAESLTEIATESITETAAESATRQEAQPVSDGAVKKLIKKHVKSMSLEDKVSGLFIITPEALTGYGAVTEAGEVTKEALEATPVAGLIYFSGNIESRDQFSRMLENTEEWGSIDLQAEAAEDSTSGKDQAGKASADSGKSSGKEEASSDTGKTGDAAKASLDSEKTGASKKSKDEVQTIHIPIFLASDEEGGLVARIEDSGIGVPYVGPMGEVGASGDPAAAFEAGSTIGGYLHELGINLDFAPDADVLIDPYNQTIGNRSFGTDPFLCGQMVGRFIDGLHDQGVASCIKHFPGLGDTETDTHTGGAWSSRAIEDYRGAEFVSFQGGIEAGTDMVMVSHLSNTALTGSDLPASLNKVVMTDILRDELKFEGVIVTDSLQMGAVTERFDSAEAAVTALEAGADILLMPIDFQAARQGILDAVESGRISEKRIDQSLRRILMTRYRTGARRLDLRETGEAD